LKSSFIGFDGSQDTPVESLHVFLLGIVKYLVIDFMQSVKDKHSQLEAYWNSFDIKSLNIDYIKPDDMIRHVASLVGKDYKAILQAAPFVFLIPLMDEEGGSFGLPYATWYL
jgi:hypothetical protein